MLDRMQSNLKNEANRRKRRFFASYCGYNTRCLWAQYSIQLRCARKLCKFSQFRYASTNSDLSFNEIILNWCQLAKMEKKKTKSIAQVNLTSIGGTAKQPPFSIDAGFLKTLLFFWFSFQLLTINSRS